MKILRIPLACLALAGLLCGCANFVNSMDKSIHGAALLSDGAMQSYAAYWKYETNKLGAIPALFNQRSNVMVLSYKVGSSLYTADTALKAYKANVGTNTTTKAIVQALVTTAIQDAGNIAGQISVLTGDPSWQTIH